MISSPAEYYLQPSEGRRNSLMTTEDVIRVAQEGFHVRFEICLVRIID